MPNAPVGGRREPLLLALLADADDGEIKGETTTGSTPSLFFIATGGGPINSSKSSSMVVNLFHFAVLSFALLTVCFLDRVESRLPIESE